MRRLRWAIVAVVLLAGAAAFLLLYKPRSDRELIEDLITRLEQGVRQKQFARIMACISDNYQDHLGLNKRDLTRLALEYMRSEGRVDLLLSDVQIDIQDGAAVATMYVEVTYIEPEMTSHPFSGKVTVFFKKEGRHWFIVKSAGWQSAAGGAALE